jgi:hypothetical protein
MRSFLSWENGSESFGRATQHACHDGKATTGFVNISIDAFTTSLNSGLDWRFQLVGFNNDTTNFPSFSNRLAITPNGGTLLLDVTITQSALSAAAYRTVSLANNLNLGTGYDNYVWCIIGDAGANGNKTYFDNISVQTADPVSPLSPVISMTSPTNGASGQAPASFTLAADASDPDGTITQVEFFSGTTSLGVDSSAPYSVNWNNVPAGSYNLSAVATDDGGNTTPATAVSVTVTAPPVPPTVAITSPADGAWLAAPADLTITANDGAPGVDKMDMEQSARHLREHLGDDPRKTVLRGLPTRSGENGENPQGQRRRAPAWHSQHHGSIDSTSHPSNPQCGMGTTLQRPQPDARPGSHLALPGLQSGICRSRHRRHPRRRSHPREPHHGQQRIIPYLRPHHCQRPQG